MDKKEHILLAEDDQDFGSILKQYLEVYKYQVTWAKDGEAAFSLFQKGNFDICVFDVMMPKLDGFSLAEKVIHINPEVPFIFLTARKMKEDKIKGLKLGADDYIVKPFEAEELLLRISNIIKRSKGSKPKESTMQEIVSIGAYQFNANRLELILGDTIQRLTGKESELIQYLYQHKNQLLRREDILKSVWKSDDFFSGRSMDVFISRLRKYFKDDACISIESIRSVGLEFKVC